MLQKRRYSTKIKSAKTFLKAHPRKFIPSKYTRYTVCVYSFGTGCIWGVVDGLLVTAVAVTTPRKALLAEAVQRKKMLLITIQEIVHNFI